MRFFLIAGCLPLVLGACGEETRPPSFRFVEWIDLAGSCKEDHANVGADDYKGGIKHYISVSDGRLFMVGFVHRKFDAARMIESVQNRRYAPPSGVEFLFMKDNPIIGAEGQRLTLKGNVSSEKGVGLAATCDLAIVSRGGRSPSLEEMRGWSLPGSSAEPLP